MGDFFFWPKNGVSSIKVSLWYFKILSRFTFLNFAVWFFIMGDAFHWTGGSQSRPFIPLCCFLMVLLPSCLSGSLPVQNFSQIVMVHFHNFVTLFICLGKAESTRRWDSTPLKWGRGRGSDFAGSDACWVHHFFSIFKASTANQGKRKHMSFLSSLTFLHLTANKSNLLFSH